MPKFCCVHGCHEVAVAIVHFPNGPLPFCDPHQQEIFRLGFPVRKLVRNEVVR